MSAKQGHAQSGGGREENEGGHMSMEGGSMMGRLSKRGEGKHGDRGGRQRKSAGCQTGHGMMTA